MKIATIQPKIENDFRETVDGQFRLMEVVAKKGAEVIVLPELATTGFTGKMARGERQMVKEHISDTIERIKTWSKAKQTVVSFGSAIFSNEHSDKPSNSMLTIFPDGSCFTDEKIHLKEGNEEQFFRAGIRRAGFTYKEVKFDFVICREFRNIEEADALITRKIDIVFWPGCIRHNTNDDSIDDLSDEKLCGFAKKNSVCILASNWANFPDGDPSRPGNMGGSSLVAPNGTVAARCKWDEDDYLIFEYSNASGNLVYSTSGSSSLHEEGIPALVEEKRK